MDHRYDPPLEDVVLLRRYKRFLADVERADGTQLTVHCANPGAMLGCSTPGSAARIRDSGKTTRKLRFDLEQVCAGRSWVGVNTQRPNAVAAAAIARGAVPGLSPDAALRREVADGAGHRLDLCLEGADGRHWVEVKSTTLRVGTEARFPDARTERGRRHLHALMALVRAGERATQLFVVSRGDARAFRPADDIDPAYGEALRAAHAAGVGVCAVRARHTKAGIRVDRALPIALDPPRGA